MSAVYPPRIRLDGVEMGEGDFVELGFRHGTLERKGVCHFTTGTKSVQTIFCLKDIDIPSSSGFATLTYKNVGRMDNDGWELTVNFNKVVEKVSSRWTSIQTLLPTRT